MKFIEIFGKVIESFNERKPIAVDHDGRIILCQDRTIVSVTKAVAAAANYDAEDVVSNSATAYPVAQPWEFVVTDQPQGFVRIVRASVIFGVTNQTPLTTLYLYTAVPSCAMGDGVANTGVALLDVPLYVGKIDFPALEDLGGMSESFVTTSTYGNLPIEFRVNDPQCKIYGILVLRDAMTNEAAGQSVTIKMTVEHFSGN